jgi:ABC-type transporter MlaC component
MYLTNAQKSLLPTTFRINVVGSGSQNINLQFQMRKEAISGSNPPSSTYIEYDVAIFPI